MMEPNIVHAPERNLVGLCIQTNHAENKTRALWQAFKPKVKEVARLKNADFFSVQKFSHNLLTEPFTPLTMFEKWAAVEVHDFEQLPEGLEALVLPAGLYAVFIHKGTPETFNQTAAYIFGQWLPNAAYLLDNRPHFEIMKPDYSPTDPHAEEEVWIPLIAKV